MPLPLIDPVAFRLFNIEIRWYGIAWALGFLIVYFFLNKYKKLAKVKDSDETILILALFVLIFSKLFAVIYHPEYLKTILTVNFLRSGFASIGAFVGLIIGILFLKQKKKIDGLMLFILIALPLILSQSIGRIGNYANHEFNGLPCDCFWCVKIDVCRHPAQIYEAIGEFLLFIFLYIIFKKTILNEFEKKKKIKKESKIKMIGIIILLYSLVRFFVEFFKDMPRIFGLNLTQWQLIGIVLIYFFILKMKILK